MGPLVNGYRRTKQAERETDPVCVYSTKFKHSSLYNYHIVYHEAIACYTQSELTNRKCTNELRVAYIRIMLAKVQLRTY